MPEGIHAIILDVKDQLDELTSRATEMEAFLDDMRYSPYQKEATSAALTQAGTDLAGVKSTLDTIRGNLASVPPPYV